MTTDIQQPPGESKLDQKRLDAFFPCTSGEMMGMIFNFCGAPPSVLLALLPGNAGIPGDYPLQRPDLPARFSDSVPRPSRALATPVRATGGCGTLTFGASQATPRYLLRHGDEMTPLLCLLQHSGR
jgi:hypothetical protein